MNVSTILSQQTVDATIPDDYEVLTRILEYAMLEAERNGEAYCAALISRAVDALSSRSREMPSTPLPRGRTAPHLS